MSQTMKIVVREQHCGKSVTLYISILHKDGPNEFTSQVFNIDNLAEVRLKFKTTKEHIFTSLSLKKHESAQGSTVKLEVNSEHLNFSQQCTCSDDWSDWKQMNNGRCEIFEYIDAYNLTVFHIDMTVYEEKSFVSEKMYQDSDLTDFILSTTDGNIAVHKIFLAAHSDVFKTMLLREWKETAEGRLLIEGVTLENLQHLKQYLYLGTLPDKGVELLPLLQLAKCYLIDNLKSACISKVARIVKSEELDDVLVFAVESKIPELLSAILQMTHDKIIHEAYGVKKKEQKTEKAVTEQSNNA